MSFKDITSHEREINLLRNALRSGKISHAYIFSGIDGIGKRLTALTFAKAINCKYIEYDSCDKCSSCIKIEKGIHPDVKLIEPDGRYIKIDQIRNIKREIYFRPFEGKKKIYIVDSAEKMNIFASNSLLKILEEPPSETIIILITSKIDFMLPTIISRCQKIPFSPIERNNIEKFLIEKSNMDSNISFLMSRIAQGSLNRAFMFDDRLIDEYKKIVSLINGRKSNKMRDIFEFIHYLSGKERDDLYKILYLLKLWIRDIIIFKELSKEDCLINADIVEDIKNLSKVMDINSLFNMIHVIDNVEMDLEKNANIELALDGMMIRFISIREGKGQKIYD
jgi:DNA polymerase-3 subunit delta'